jgi:hypothetical protein
VKRLVLSLTLLLAGCATAPRGDVGLYADPGRHVGQTVRLHGFLQYGDSRRGRNLYPTRHVDRDRLAGRCLPLEFDDAELQQRAFRMDGSYVVVEGTVERLLTGDDFSFFWCKDHGLRVTHVGWR